MRPTLLLADDSVTIQRVIELTFADEGIQVVAVSDGDQAVARVEESPPDIVLADVGMPGRNGYEVARYIKSSPRLAHIPVVLLTGAFEPVDQERARAAGCDGVLAKPFEPQAVISRVKELLGRAAKKADAAAPPTKPTTATEADTQPVEVALDDLPEEPPTVPRNEVEMGDDYFDRLDAAFSNMSAAPGASPTHAASPTPRIPEEMDWFNPDPPATEPPVDLPLSTPPSIMNEPSMPERSLATSSAEPAAPPAGAQGASKAVAPPPLADVFAALLAAEQDDPESDPGTWPGVAAAAPPPNGTPIATDALVDQITHRVLEQMTDRAVRDAVADIVTHVAERLVREEIERIKASIK